MFFRAQEKCKQSIVVISFPILSAVVCGWGGFDLVQKGLKKELSFFLGRVNSSCQMLGVCALRRGSFGGEKNKEILFLGARFNFTHTQLD